MTSCKAVAGASESPKPQVNGSVSEEKKRDLQREWKPRAGWNDQIWMDGGTRMSERWVGWGTVRAGADGSSQMAGLLPAVQ